MTNITEDYVSFETAKLLKEKGFDIHCPTAYETMTSEHHVEETAFSDWGKLGQVKRPTLQMAMKWLREVHHIPIEILWHYDGNSDIEEWYFIHHAELRILPNDIKYFDTYEEACEAAIKYCLENLI